MGWSDILSVHVFRIAALVDLYPGFVVFERIDSMFLLHFIV